MQAVYNYLVVDPNNTFLRAVLLTIISSLIALFFAARGRLRWYQTGQYVYSMPIEGQLNLTVHTKQIWIVNTGRASIKNIEIVLNFKPQHFEIWPPRNYTQKDHPGGTRESILIDNLAPREGFMLAMLESRQNIGLGEVNAVRSETDWGRQVAMHFARNYPVWLTTARIMLFMFGLGSAIQYTIIFFVRLIAIFNTAPAP